MKKKLGNRLSLKKMTVSNLNDSQMKIFGGTNLKDTNTCVPPLSPGCTTVPSPVPFCDTNTYNDCTENCPVETEGCPIETVNCPIVAVSNACVKTI